MDSLLVARRESVAPPMVPTLSPHTASQIRESCVLPRPKIQDEDACWVCERGSFAAVAGADASVRVVVLLKAATALAASTTTSTAAASTGSCNLCRHRQLNSHVLGSTGSWETGRRAPHGTLLDEGLESGVQARWSIVGEEPELVTDVLKGDGFEGARLG